MTLGYREGEYNMTKREQYIEKLKEKKEQLEKSQVIENYLTLIKTIEDEERKIGVEKREIQKECNHDLWYLLESEVDDYDNRSYWTCKCVLCELEAENRPSFFCLENVIMEKCIFGRGTKSEVPFKEIQSQYQSLLLKYKQYFEQRKLAFKEAGYSLEYDGAVVNKILFKKHYNEFLI